MTFAKKCYTGSIKAADTRAERLTMEQLSSLVTWTDWQQSHYFEQFPIQFALNMYHTTAAWDTLDGLFDEADDDEIAAVVRGYNAGLKLVCGLRGAAYNAAKLNFTPRDIEEAA